MTRTCRKCGHPIRQLESGAFGALDHIRFSCYHVPASTGVAESHGGVSTGADERVQAQLRDDRRRPAVGGGSQPAGFAGLPPLANPAGTTAGGAR